MREQVCFSWAAAASSPSVAARALPPRRRSGLPPVQLPLPLPAGLPAGPPLPVRLVCLAVGTRLRVRVIEAPFPFDPSCNCAFPRALRRAGQHYRCERLGVQAGKSYRASGRIVPVDAT